MVGITITNSFVSEKSTFLINDRQVKAFLNLDGE